MMDGQKTTLACISVLIVIGFLMIYEKKMQGAWKITEVILINSAATNITKVFPILEIVYFV